MELFIGPWNQSANWSVEGLGGVFRFLQRVWVLVQEYQLSKKSETKGSEDLLKLINQTIYKVSKDLDNLGFNTAIAALMETTNELYKVKAKDNFAAKNWGETLDILLQLLAPFAPHIAEELWHQLGNKDSIHISSWPVHDDKYLVSDKVIIVVQINGKVRANLEMPTNSSEKDISKVA